MRRLAILFSLLAGVAVAIGLASAQLSPVTFTCIVGDAHNKCPDGTLALRGYNPAPPPGLMYVSVSGYFKQSDGGAGKRERHNRATTDRMPDRRTRHRHSPKDVREG